MSPHILGQQRGPDQHRDWWKEGSVYQIYPASFKDSTGSGTGDLKGIISKVDYLKELGVDIVWLSPIFESPQVDMGYDISDYSKIHGEYGSVEDVDILKEKLHERGMKLVLDLVVNHTSDQHQWFINARSSKSSEFRDWYIWKKPKYDANGNRQPPNNWKSHFQGSAWEYDEASGEYYLHLFCKEQPDLNWENPAVRKAVYETTRFWLDRGIDGFRLDVINFISKHQDFPDSSSLVHPGSEFYAAGPRLHEYLRDLGTIFKEYDAFSVGEMPCVHDPKEIIKGVRSDRGELNMIFHFELMDIDHGPQGKFSPRQWSLAQLKETTNKWQQFMYRSDGWNAIYLENHDQPRSVSRFASDSVEFRERSAKMLAVFLGFQAGTPFIYQGQELGMHNVPKEWPMDEYKDIDCLNHWRLYENSASPEALDTLRKEYQKKSRDNARTPMQWDASAHAGFTSASSTPWMTVHPNYTTINASAQLKNTQSVFHCWQSVLKQRKLHKDVFVYGNFDLVDEANNRVFAYSRTYTDGDNKQEIAVVVCNFSDQTVDWDGLKNEVVKEMLLATEPSRKLEDFSLSHIRLAPYEGVVVLL